ncbi:suppressor of fused domain protein [Pseudomonas solani]|uniref:suppressor of fused domain protein n=1 Tax=Pseudomonas solani TaxID=2731552 RepID=UPI003C2B75F1
MEFFRKLFGSSKQPAAENAPATPAPGNAETPYEMTEAEAAKQAALEASSERLDLHWQSIGTVERDVLAYLISPSFTGGPYWPSTRQAYRVVRRAGSILLATDGLSSPFDDGDEPVNGFEMELFIDTPDIPEHARGAMGEVDPLKQSWAFELLENVAKTVANAGGITAQLQQHGALSLELPGVSQSHHLGEQLPPAFVTDDDCIGVLLGGPKPDFATHLEDMPLSPVILVPVVLITASELDYVRAGGYDARQDLLQRLKAAGVGHRSALGRDSVV